MASTCEQCNKPFDPWRYDQRRFCSVKCGSAFYDNERRIAVQAYRAQQRGMSYHSLAQLDEDRPGGRFGLLPSRRMVTGAGGAMQPLPTSAWAKDPTGQEPFIEGNSDVLGEALGGAGGEPAR
jgi:hypothetical protein